MKLSKHIILTNLDSSVNWSAEFTKTVSGESLYSLNSIDIDEGYNLKTFKFNISQKNPIPNLETKTVQNHYYGGVVVSLTFSDNTFNTSLHNLSLKRIYEDILLMISKHLANKLIKDLRLNECVIRGFVSKHQFKILKPHKRVADDWIDSEPEYLYILKNGVIVPYPLEKLGIAYNKGFIKALEGYVLDALMRGGDE